MVTINIDEIRLEQLKALASATRLQILNWLQDPSSHFSAQVTGDPAEIGVCVTLIAKKLGMSQPTVSRHLDIMKRCRLITSRRVQSWAFFSRNEKELQAFNEWFSKQLSPIE
ncbi:ArsR/SmtB family transcription factor [Brenneria goodwinii]|uniref:ArsR/SmtB family transcription factor n=1 Tax=Brenneria goodwinii TaxID=1109412 RepID=UPI0036F36BDF